MKLLLLVSFCLLIVACVSPQVIERDINEPLIKSATIASDTQTILVGDSAGTFMPKYLTEYRYLERSDNTPTEVALWITQDNSGRFHVPWHIGGDWFNDTSEKIIVDPVNKTVSIGFEEAIQNNERCSEAQRVSGRSVYGYFVCNSLFADFKLVEENTKLERDKPITKDDIDDAPSLFQRLVTLFGEDDVPLSVVPDEALNYAKDNIERGVKEYTVSVDLEQLALTVAQLNLLTAAERKLSGESETLGALETRLMNKLIATQRYYERSLITQQNNAIREYIDSVENIPFEIKPQTFDKSGYYNYDIIWPMAVSLVPSSIDVKVYHYTHYVNAFKKFELNDASEALASLTLSKMKKQFRKDRVDVARYIDKSARQYQVNCDFPRIIGDYRVAIQCPDFASVSEGKVSISLVYEVLAKRFDQVMPRYTNHNNDLTITADSETLSLTNNSGGDLKINGIEWLANNAAQSITRHTDKAKVFSIARGQSVAINLNDSMGESLKKELDVPYLSRRKALRKHFEYGFDVSYQVLGTTQSQTDKTARLYQTNRYGLNDLLMSR